MKDHGKEAPRFRKLTDGELKAARPAPGDILGVKRYPVAVILENIRSLNNVGSIFRTADGAGIGELCICGYTGYPPRAEIDKTALGSVEFVPWRRVPNQFEALREYRARGYCIAALEHTSAGIPYNGAEYRFPLCLVIGNEVQGVTPEFLSLCDMAVEIPMFGRKQSLNVAVAFGIMAYHLVERYRASNGIPEY